ncbi:UNVERIFIED_CONTAM: CCR4-NOT transcription complex subunit [Sesamum calycinum]|uniref:CCR4-NOT transcription complex subunit n=1 Tax=Sesamum calycinum TaxID=2727403 RepID=A0AAW2SZX8_9LAMI
MSCRFLPSVLKEYWFDFFQMPYLASYSSVLVFVFYEHNYTFYFQVPGSSFSLIGPGSAQTGLLVSSPIQLPQRPTSSLDERKPSLSNYMKPAQFSGGQTAIAPSSDTAGIQKARFGSALNIETLVAAAERRETPIEAPASEIQDKISFIINNLSAANVEAKAKEFTEILNEQYYPWFAQYMVMKSNLKALNKEIVQATYENCKVLLGSELIKSSVEERSLLKNLGSWLGKITIGKNQVLRAREIDPKSLIIEAYEKGLMIAVIPFTSKVLFKNLGVDLKEVTPTSLLKDRVREVEGNPDFSNKDVGSSQPPIVNEVKSGIISTLNQVEVPLDVAAPPHAGGHSRIVSQESGTAAQPMNSALASERPGSNVLEPLLTTGDALDKYQTISEKELSVSHCVSSEVMNSSPSPSHQGQPLSFLAIDICAKLVFSILKVLAVTVKFIQKDAEEKGPLTQAIFFCYFDLCSLDPVFDGANFQVLTALANSFHAIQPLKVPGFSFAWLELVSHRSFMPKLLTANAQKGWPYFQRLLVDLFQFMEPFLRNAELGEPVHFLYKGTLRVLLVLLHDFPEFLCDYHFSFCDVIPPSCIQMRNIILSAFPRNMRLPDPSTPNLKIDLLAEISQSPRSEVDAALKAKQIKSDVDEYLKAIQQLQARAPSHSQSMASMTAFLVSAALDIFQTLIMDLDTEGRYLFLNAVANQLRYPNNHTHYFSFILLYLFAESNQEMIQEQITRVLLERLIVNRPHPWGLLITFIELIKNPRYNFWSRSFTRCAPEIEKLFESVSRSCGGPKPVDDSVVSGGIPDNMH